VSDLTKLKMKKTLLFFLIVISCFCLLVPTGIVEFAQGAHTHLANFDTDSPGAYSGSGTYYAFNRHSGNYLCSNDYATSGANSLRVNGEGWLNFTNFAYMSEFSFWMRTVSFGSTIHMYMLNDTVTSFSDIRSSLMLYIYFQTDGYVYMEDSEGNTNKIDGSLYGTGTDSAYGYAQIVITHSINNNINISGYNHSGVFKYGITDTATTVSDWTNVRQIIFGSAGVGDIYFDDFNATITTPPDEGYEDGEDTGDDFTLRFFDVNTGYIMKAYGGGCSFTERQFIELMYRNRVQGRLTSDLWTGTYETCGYGGLAGVEIDINATFVDGSYHWINLTAFDGYEFMLGRILDNPITYQNFSRYMKLNRGTVYDLYLIRAEDYVAPDYTYCEDMNWQHLEGCMGDQSKWKMCLNNYTYDFGEILYLSMYMPSKEWLQARGMPVNNWDLELWDESEYTWSPLITFFEGVDFYLPGQCSNIYFQFELSALVGIKPDQWSEYKLQLVNRDPILDMTAGEIFFVCTGESFNPDGNILWIAPDPATTYQQITIGFNCTGVPKFEIYDMTRGKVYRNHYPGATHNQLMTYNISIEIEGFYEARLFCFNGWRFELVDSKTFNVTGYFSQPGFVGYNAEYLECRPYRFVAGDPSQNVTIHYQTFLNDSLLRIETPRGENSSYSCTVNNDSRIFSFWLPSGVAIGTWNVTLFGQDTHYSSFNVVNEEGNYIEFGRNIYFPDQSFNIIIKHSYAVALTFYKDDVPQGESWRLRVDEYPSELKPLKVPAQYASPSMGIGEWRVEMWRVNEENQMYKLAEWECTVQNRKAEGDIGDTDLRTMVKNAFPDATQRATIGLGICLLITLLPFLISLKLKQSHVTIQIPSVLYGVCFGAGTGVSYLFGFFEFEVMFFLCFIMIAILGFAWFMAKRSAASASEA